MHAFFLPGSCCVVFDFTMGKLCILIPVTNKSTCLAFYDVFLKSVLRKIMRDI